MPLVRTGGMISLKQPVAGKRIEREKNGREKQRNK